MSIILLEHPRPKDPKRFEDVVNTPLSSCLMTGYIASSLKSNNFDVEIIDANLHGWSFNETIHELKSKSFKLLGVHLIYLWENTEEVLGMLMQLRDNGIAPHINIYGHLPTFAFNDILANHSFIGSAIIGEPEITFVELAETIVNANGPSTLNSIDGLAFNSSHCTNGNNKHNTTRHGIIVNRPRDLISNLDELPFPERYEFDLSKKKGISTYILASRGCYGKCTFCYLDNFYGDASYWRGRTPENVFDEINHLHQNLGVKYFYFADANFIGPGRKGKERACDIADLIREKDLNINFGIECRANDVEDATISKLVKAGLKDVFLGIESGSQNSLERYKKFTSVEDNKNAINILRKYGIVPNYGFIMFGPCSTLDEVRENFEFLKEMKMLAMPSITAHLLHHKQTIFKGTIDYEKLKDNGKPVSSLGYEQDYEIKDEKVANLAGKVNTFCNKALKDLSKNNNLKMVNDSCSYDEDNSFSQRINKELIDNFEMVLSACENNEDGH